MEETLPESPIELPNSVTNDILHKMNMNKQQEASQYLAEKPPVNPVNSSLTSLEDPSKECNMHLLANAVDHVMYHPPSSDTNANEESVANMAAEPDQQHRTTSAISRSSSTFQSPAVLAPYKDNSLPTTSNTMNIAVGLISAQNYPSSVQPPSSPMPSSNYLPSGSSNTLPASVSSMHATSSSMQYAVNSKYVTPTSMPLPSHIVHSAPSSSYVSGSITESPSSSQHVVDTAASSVFSPSAGTIYCPTNSMPGISTMLQPSSSGLIKSPSSLTQKALSIWPSGSSGPSAGIASPAVSSIPLPAGIASPDVSSIPLPASNPLYTPLSSLQSNVMMSSLSPQFQIASSSVTFEHKPNTSSLSISSMLGVSSSFESQPNMMENARQSSISSVSTSKKANLCSSDSSSHNIASVSAVPHLNNSNAGENGPTSSAPTHNSLHSTTGSQGYTKPSVFSQPSSTMPNQCEAAASCSSSLPESGQLSSTPNNYLLSQSDSPSGPSSSEFSVVQVASSSFGSLSSALNSGLLNSGKSVFSPCITAAELKDAVSGSTDSPLRPQSDSLLGSSKVVSDAASLTSHIANIPLEKAKITSASGEKVTSASGEKITSASGEKVTSASGEKVTSASGEKVTSASGEKVTSASGEKVTSASGEKVTSASGEKVTSASGEKVTSASGEKVTSAFGEKVTLASGEKVTSAFGEKVTSAFGEKLTSASGEKVTSASGEKVTSAFGEKVTAASSSDADNTSLQKVMSISVEKVTSGSNDKVTSASGDKETSASGNKVTNENNKAESDKGITTSEQSCVTSGEKNNSPKVNNVSFEAEHVTSGSGNLYTKTCVTSVASNATSIKKTSTPEKALPNSDNVTSSPEAIKWGQNNVTSGKKGQSGSGNSTSDSDHVTSGTTNITFGQACVSSGTNNGNISADSVNVTSGNNNVSSGSELSIVTYDASSLKTGLANSSLETNKSVADCSNSLLESSYAAQMIDSGRSNVSSSLIKSDQESLSPLVSGHNPSYSASVQNSLHGKESVQGKNKYFIEDDTNSPMKADSSSSSLKTKHVTENSVSKEENSCSSTIADLDTNCLKTFTKLKNKEQDKESEPDVSASKADSMVSDSTSSTNQKDENEATGSNDPDPALKKTRTDKISEEKNNLVGIEGSEVKGEMMEITSGSPLPMADSAEDQGKEAVNKSNSPGNKSEKCADTSTSSTDMGPDEMSVSPSRCQKRKRSLSPVSSSLAEPRRSRRQSKSKFNVLDLVGIGINIDYSLEDVKPPNKEVTKSPAVAADSSLTGDVKDVKEEVLDVLVNEMDEMYCNSSDSYRRFKEKIDMEKIMAPFEIGWRREVVIRNVYEEFTKCGKPKRVPADVYYYAPCRRKLRSMVQIVNYLREAGSGLTSENFNFMRKSIYKPPFEVVRHAGSRGFGPKTRAPRNSPKGLPKPAVVIDRDDVHDHEDDGCNTAEEGEGEDSLSIEPELELAIAATALTVQQVVPSQWISSFGEIKEKSIKSEPMVKMEIKNLTNEGAGGQQMLVLQTPTPGKRPLENSNSSEKKPKRTKSVARKSTSQLPKSLSLADVISQAEPFQPCSLSCPGLAGIPPTLHCDICMCLFHIACVNLKDNEVPKVYTCKNCMKDERFVRNKLVVNINTTATATATTIIPPAITIIPPAITTTTTTTSTTVASKAIPTSLSSVASKAIPTSLSSVASKAIPTILSSVASKAIPTILSSVASKAIPTSLSSVTSINSPSSNIVNTITDSTASESDKKAKKVASKPSVIQSLSKEPSAAIVSAVATHLPRKHSNGSRQVVVNNTLSMLNGSPGTESSPIEIPAEDDCQTVSAVQLTPDSSDHVICTQNLSNSVRPPIIPSRCMDCTKATKNAHSSCLTVKKSPSLPQSSPPVPPLLPKDKISVIAAPSNHNSSNNPTTTTAAASTTTTTTTSSSSTTNINTMTTITSTSTNATTSSIDCTKDLTLKNSMSLAPESPMIVSPSKLLAAPSHTLPPVTTSSVIKMETLSSSSSSSSSSTHAHSGSGVNSVVGLQVSNTPLGSESYPRSGQLLTLPSAVAKRLNPSLPLALRINNMQLLIPPSRCINTAEGLKVFLPPKTFSVPSGSTTTMNITFSSGSMSADNAKDLSLSMLGKDKSMSLDMCDEVVDLSKPAETAKPVLKVTERRNKMKNYLCPFKTLYSGYNTMIHIFSYLSAGDLVRCSLVCRTWRRLATQSCLWNAIHLENTRISDWARATQFFSRYFVEELSLRGMQYEDDWNRVWHQLTPVLEQLTTLKRLYFDHVPALMLYTVCQKLPQLEDLGANMISDFTNEQQWTTPTKIDLAKFCSLKHLRKLQLRGTGGLASSFSSGISEMVTLKYLQHLSLTSMKSVGDHDLDYLGELKGLRVLEMGDCTNWTSETYFQLGKLVNLEKLRLEHGGEIPDVGLADALLNLKSLLQLELITFVITDTLHLALSQLKNLRKLVVWPDTTHQPALINSNTFVTVVKLPNLKQLEWGVVRNKNSSIILNESRSVTTASNSIMGSDKDLGDNMELIPFLTPDAQALASQTPSSNGQMSTSSSGNFTEYISMRQLSEKLKCLLTHTQVTVFRTLDDASCVSSW